MSGTIVSVIVPYLESNNKLIDTLSSICKQRNFDSTKVEVLIIDTTESTNSRASIGNLSICKVISTKAIDSFADACNLAMENAVGQYITVCHCGDRFSDNFFQKAVDAFNRFENVPYVTGKRFCINPIFKEKKAFRLNKAADNTRVISLADDPNMINLEVTGTLYKAEIFKSYKFNGKLKYESADDFSLRIQLDYPEYVYASDIEYDYFMPVSDDFLYYIPSNYKDWYKESLESFLMPLILDSREKQGIVPEFIQFYTIFNISTKFLANMNNRNKRNMSNEELAEFFEAARRCLQYVDNSYVLNRNKYKSLGYSEEAAEMFYMLKYNCVFNEMPLVNVEGKREVYLTCDRVFVSRLTDQRVGIHVMDYRDGKLVIDGSFRRVFSLDDIDLYVQFNDQQYSLTDTDRYSLTKYFGISAYKKFTFHLELPLDPNNKRQTVSFFARYRYTVIPLKLSFLHHWSKFTIKPANSYWRFNKYVAYVDNVRTITIQHASAFDTIKRELRFLPGVFAESKRSFITRIQYWLTRPFFKNKKIWLMYDKLYKGGDSCEYLYRYCANKNDGISRYYIIDKNTSDYKRLKADGLKPVKNHSFKHKMLFLNTDIALITNSNVFPFNG